MRPLTPTTVSVAEFALGVAVRRGGRDWSVLLVGDRPRCEATARELVEEVRSVAAVDAQALALTGRFLEDLRATEAPVVVTYEGDVPVASIWPSLDLDRSLIPPARSVVLVLSNAAYDRLEREAPNLASWLGAAVATADAAADVLSAEEREARLQALRARFAMTDEEILDGARAGGLPRDPGVAEWLVLLGRGDLLERSG